MQNTLLLIILFLTFHPYIFSHSLAPYEKRGRVSICTVNLLQKIVGRIGLKTTAWAYWGVEVAPLICLRANYLHRSRKLIYHCKTRAISLRQKRH